MEELMLKVDDYVEKNIIKDKLYRVTEVSQIIGVKPPILRKWQNEFELKIPVDKQGRKFYTYQEIKVLLKIKELKTTGADVQFITKIIKSRDKSIPCNEIADKNIITKAIDNTTIEKTPKEVINNEEELAQKVRREELLLERMIMRIYQRDEVIAKSYEEMLKEAKGKAKDELLALIKKHYEQLMADNGKLIAFIKEQRLAPKQEKVPWYQQIFG